MTQEQSTTQNSSLAACETTDSLNQTRTKPQLISVVVPCYNEEEVFEELIKRLFAVLNTLNIEFEVILIDDGSKDKTWAMMQAASARNEQLKIIKLSRNYGHQIALSCGLDQAAGDVVLVIDADLQDPPELLPKMLDKWREGFDVVYGQRIKRHGEPLSKKIFAYCFYRTFRKLTGFELPSDTGDFRLIDRKALEALLKLRERHRFIRGMVSWVGFKQAALPYERPERFAGVTKYPIRKSLFLAIDAITSFSFAPLRLASYMGITISAFSFVYIIVVLYLRFFTEISWPGYTSIMAAVLFLGGVQLVVLGIMGEYVGRIFEQGQKRPLYFIDQIYSGREQRK
jgi:glycosyltransferase involved in cell wall biosynthesis